MTLSNLNVSEEALIISIEANDTMKKRLLDLGLIPGTKVKAILSSGNNEFVAYMIRGTLIAIRKEDAKKIRVILI